MEIKGGQQRLDADICRLSYRHFVREFFQVVEPQTEFQEGWHIDAICDHLQAVSEGHIRKLIINIPPRHMKSLLTSVLWNAWEWTREPNLRWLHASYAEKLSLRDSVKTRNLVASPKYQQWYGDKFKLIGAAKHRFETDQGGFRQSSSVDGSNTGEGGDRVVIDDPHNMRDITSGTMRLSVLDWWDNVMITRLNDPKKSAFILIMQRGHVGDLTGHLLSQDSEWVHLMLPARFEVSRKCTTIVDNQQFFVDKREKEGELLWPDRFGEVELGKIEKALGSYGTAGQLQQRPSPSGGGIVEIDWFRRYKEPPTVLKNIVMSWDCANKAKSLNAWNVCMIFTYDEKGDKLLDVIRFRAEYPELKRTAINLCLKWKPSAVVIEDKANGIALIQDLKQDRRWPIIPIEPERDKITRMSVESPYIEAGNVWLPEEASWLPDLEVELTSFPNSEWADQTDTLSQYLMWRRLMSSRKSIGLANLTGH